MRRWTVVVVGGLVLGSVGAGALQITEDPLPGPVRHQGLSVRVADLVQLPETRGMRPAHEDVNPPGWARVSFVRDLPDGRRFVNEVL